MLREATFEIVVANDNTTVRINRYDFTVYRWTQDGARNVRCSKRVEHSDAFVEALADFIESYGAAPAVGPFVLVDSEESERPACGHSACVQYWIDTGESECVGQESVTCGSLTTDAEQAQCPACITDSVGEDAA